MKRSRMFRGLVLVMFNAVIPMLHEFFFFSDSKIRFPTHFAMFVHTKIVFLRQDE